MILLSPSRGKSTPAKKIRCKNKGGNRRTREDVAKQRDLRKSRTEENERGQKLSQPSYLNFNKAVHPPT